MSVLRLQPSGDDLTAESVLHAFNAVARRLGIDTSIENLRRTYVLGEGGIETGTIIAIARDLGLEARAVSMTWAGLPRLQKALPAILRLADGTALVLEAVRDDPRSGRVAVLHDPTAAPDAMIALDEAQLTKVWAGEVILVKRHHRLTEDDQPFGLRWLMGQVLRERGLFIEIAVAALVTTVFTMAPPFLFMVVLDRVIANQSHSTLIIIGAVYLVMIVFEMALSYLKRVFTDITTTRIDGRLYLHIMDRLLRLPIDYFEHNPTGMITSKLYQVWRIRNFLTGQLFGTFLDAVPLIGLIPAIFILQWRLALWVLALTGIIFVIVVLFIGPLNRRHQRVVKAEQARSSHLVETISGMRTIKSLALEGRRRREWDGLVAEAAAARHELGMLANHPRTWSLPFERLIYSGSVVIGAYIVLVEPEVMSPGTLVAFAMLSMRIAQPLVRMASLLQDVAEVRGAITEVATVMNVPPEQARAGTGLRLPITGDITFEDVRFRYTPTAPLALDRVSFHIAPGRMLGIMGRSGSGKTTVTRLLQGLHPTYEGIIKVDGMDLREIDLTHLRTSIGVVPQENFLFRGTIRDNIAMAKPGATFREIVRAAQLAGAEEFIERLPRGYDTALEENAVNLSGGQRQRLAIARALMIDPAVLILDEATSALDAESEAIINANLRRIAQDRTIICISHRLSMLVPADAILVLERGQVYDVGHHDELLQRCDIYKHLWYQQNRHTDRAASHAQIAVARAPTA